MKKLQTFKKFLNENENVLNEKRYEKLYEFFHTKESKEVDEILGEYIKDEKILQKLYILITDVAENYADEQEQNRNEYN